MDLRYSEADEAFRAELREWLARSCPSSRPSPRPTTGTAAPATTPTGSAASSTPGTPGINWPKEYGGRDASPTEQLIFLEETHAGAGRRTSA